MNTKQFLKEISLPSFDAEGYPLLGGAVIVALIGALLWHFLLWLGGIALILGALHFRKVARIAPDEDPNFIVALADGTVQEIENIPLPEYFPEAGQARTRIRVKSTWLDSQMFFAPQAGLITSSNTNNAPIFVKGDLEMERGITQSFSISAQEKIFAVVNAPLLGNKFINNTANGKNPNIGEALGMGRIVNIYDLFVPANAKLQIKEGQHMVGGETIIAQFASKKKAKTEPKQADDTQAETKPADDAQVDDA